jgi:hypothetical protein
LPWLLPKLCKIHLLVIDLEGWINSWICLNILSVCLRELKALSFDYSIKIEKESGARGSFMDKNLLEK